AKRRNGVKRFGVENFADNMVVWNLRAAQGYWRVVPCS
ncbi:hypothetical protein A2U01_0096382, partial [Trifolium medium]|nr:hypothetical protein [Trifolium medium]